MDSRPDVWYRRWLALALAAVKEFGGDRSSRMAAAIAYRTVFALAPLLILAVAVAGFLVSDLDFRDAILTEIQPVVGQEVTDVIASLMENAADARNASTVIGAALLLWSGSSLFFEVQSSLNTIFHAPPDRARGLVPTIRHRLVGVVASVGLGLVLTSIVVLNAGVSFVVRMDVFAQIPGWRTVASVAGPVVSLLVLIVVFGLLFQYMTAIHIPWKAAWRGASVTGALFVAGAFLLGLYFSGPGGGSGFSATGFAGGFVLILFLVFLLAQIFLLGAEFTKVYADYVEHGDIVMPTEREERRREEALEAVRAPPEGTLRRTGRLADVGFFAFVAGFFIGWFRRDR
jgi:membrane protein